MNPQRAQRQADCESAGRASVWSRLVRSCTGISAPGVLLCPPGPAKPRSVGHRLGCTTWPGQSVTQVSLPSSASSPGCSVNNPSRAAIRRPNPASANEKLRGISDSTMFTSPTARRLRRVSASSRTRPFEAGPEGRARRCFTARAWAKPAERSCHLDQSVSQATSRIPRVQAGTARVRLSLRYRPVDQTLPSRPESRS